MAAGNSGSFTLTSGYFSVVVNWSETYNETANTHVVSIDSCQLKSSNWYGFTYYPSGGLYINGTQVVTFNSQLGSHACTVSTQNTAYPIQPTTSSYAAAPWSSGSIAGNADGTKSVAIAAKFTCYTADGKGGSGWSVDGSQTVTLRTIPRKSSISMSATTMGSAGTITITRASTAFTHTITYAFGSATGTIATKTTSTSVSWTPGITLANHIPNSVSGTCTLTCQTYSGTTLIGTSTTTVTLSVPASVKPSISTFTVSRIDGTVPSSWGIYVQSKSKASADITSASGSYSSTITAYSISGGGSTSTTAHLETGYLQTAGTVTFTAKVQDSRGRWSDEKTVSITVVAYSIPSVSNYSVQRCLADGTSSANGTYAKAKITFSYASCSGKNTMATSTKYKKTTDSTFTDAGKSFSSGVEFVLGGGNLSAEYSYDIRFLLTDAFGSYYLQDTISTASVLMDFKAGGTGIAVGKVSEEENCFEITEDWDVKVYGMLLESYIRQKADNMYYGTCATAAATAAKVVTCSGFKLKTGAAIVVRFTYTNSAASPTLNVNSTGAKNITSYGTTAVPTYAWKAGQAVLFVYDGTSWVGTSFSHATTTYYGVTRLSSSTSSTSTVLAATASAVKAAYDRNSWDSITLTNALGLAYGGTGATTAAAARTNLGITVTQLYSGTLTTGNATFNYGNYNFYVIIGQPSSSGARVSVTVPKALLTTSAVSYQIADESYYYSFNLSYSGSTVTLAYKARSSTGQILAVYGIN